jgi:hypothetical protein
MTIDWFSVSLVVCACLLGFDLMVISVNYSFALPDSSEQVTISKDLESNPVDQDIHTEKNRADKKVDGKNRWKTMIQNASLYKQNSI